MTYAARSMASHGGPVRHFAAMNELHAQADRVEAAAADILALRPRVAAAAPWPMAELFGTEAEASWGPPELLAHLDEMLPFWLGEAERILEGDPGDPVPFGRPPTDTIRVGLIGRDRTVPFRELFARLSADSSRVARRMRELTDADGARVGLHPLRGALPVHELFERFVTSHLEGHVVQLREILEARGA